MDGSAKRPGSRSAKRRLSRRRRAVIKELLAKGKSVAQIAEWVWCSESTVREHVGALRRAASRRAVSEHGPGAAEIGDLLEGLEGAVQKVRAAQEEVDVRTPNYRELVKVEVRLLWELLGVRRELARARPEREGEELSFEELLAEARALGVDVSAYETPVRCAA